MKSLTLFVICAIFPNINGEAGPKSWCFRMNRKNQKAPTISQIQSMTVKSVNECGIQCGRRFPDCQSVSYNDQTHECILQRTFSHDTAAPPIYAAGFEFLDMKDPFDVCLSENPCKNSGNCTDDFGFDYTCKCTELYTGKNCTGLVGHVLLIGSYPSSGDFEIYNTNDVVKSKILNTTLNETRYVHVSGVFNDGTIAIAGGYKTGVKTSDTDIYDTKQNQVITGPAMNEVRAMAAGAMINNEMIVCGGQPQVNTCEKLSFNQNSSQFEWQQISPMNLSRQESAMVGVNGNLFIMGGRNTAGVLNEVEKYKPATNTWTFVAGMPTKRTFVAVAELNGQIYACGGQNATNGVITACEKYDHMTDSWTVVTSMNVKRFAHRMLSINGKIYAFGGVVDTGLTRTASVEEYDPSTNIWKIVEPMKTLRAGHTAVILLD